MNYCFNCGFKAAGVEYYCPHCGINLRLRPEQEPVHYWDEGDVKITSTRLIIGPATYSLESIKSVGISRIKESKSRVFLLFIISAMALGFVYLTSNSFSELNGLDISMLAMIILVIISSTFMLFKVLSYNLWISTPNGAVYVLSSANRVYIQRVAEAINESLGNKS